MKQVREYMGFVRQTLTFAKDGNLSLLWYSIHTLHLRAYQLDPFRRFSEKVVVLVDCAKHLDLLLDFRRLPLR